MLLYCTVAPWGHRWKIFWIYPPVIISRPPYKNWRPPVIIWRPPVNNSRPPIIMWGPPVNNWCPLHINGGHQLLYGGLHIITGGLGLLAGGLHIITGDLQLLCGSLEIWRIDSENSSPMSSGSFRNIETWLAYGQSDWVEKVSHYFIKLHITCQTPHFHSNGWFRVIFRQWVNFILSTGSV